MNVIVRAGTAIIGGTVVSLASDTTVAISTPDGTYPRFDLITLKSTGAVGYYTGTPEATVAVDAAKSETYVKPKPPTTPAGELALAEVFVPAGATAIDKIIDRRIITGLAASQVTSGRFPMARMPDGASGKVLIAQGVGVDPAYADPNFNIIQVSGTALTARDWSADFAKLQNLDLALSVLVAVQRWGRNVSPVWVHGGEVTAPAAGTALVSKTVSTGKSGYIYGFFISAGEANDFKINWTSGGTAYSRRIPVGGKGAIQYVDFTPFNEGLPADAGSSVTITNVNAGSTGIVYQAAILYAEV
jgi:hypothetical protein